jgi:hypothetical protein
MYNEFVEFNSCHSDMMEKGNNMDICTASTLVFEYYGENLYSALKYKAAQNGVSNWNKIEYIDYIHKEFQKDGVKYSSGFLAAKLNGDKDYIYFGIYLLNIQIGSSYKVLQCNDNWSRNTAIPRDRIRKNLDEIQEKWVN